MKKNVCLFTLLFAAVPLVANSSVNSMAGGEPEPLDETVVRILLVADPNVSSTDIDQAKMWLEQTWEASNLDDGLLGTGIVFANNGVPEFTSPGYFLGSIIDQYDKVKEFAEAPFLGTQSLRDFHAADVVMGLSNAAVPNDCGLAKQDDWIGGLFPGFDEEPENNGLDLSGRNKFYYGIAVIRFDVNSGCKWWTLAHEFGHLFGGTHFEQPFLGRGVHPDSNAWWWTSGPWPTSRQVTALAGRPGEDACPYQSWLTCIHVKRYSEKPAFGDNDHNNVAAFATTARSVANYRSGNGSLNAPLAMCGDGMDNDGDSLVDASDPDCGICNMELCPPTNPPPPPPACNGTEQAVDFVSEVLQVCIPGTSRTAYRVSWSHFCPGEVSKYVVHIEEPAFGTPIPRYNVGTRYIDLWIEGTQQARVRVQSCNFASCGNLSTQGSIITDIC